MTTCPAPSGSPAAPPLERRWVVWTALAVILALAAWLIWSELTARNPELQAIAMCGVPLVLAIFHIVAISKASRALEKIPVAEPPSP